MKKLYSTPDIQVTEMQTMCVICQSATLGGNTSQTGSGTEGD